METGFLEIFNHLTFNISFVIFLGYFTRAKRKKILLFFLVTFISLLLQDQLFAVMPVFLLLGIGYFYRPKKLLDSVFQIATPLFFCTVLILGLGSLFTLIFGSRISSATYDIGIGILLVALSLLTILIPYLPRRLPTTAKIPILTVEMLVIIFFSFSSLFASFSSPRKWSAVGIFVVLILLSFGCLVGSYLLKEQVLEHKEEEIKQQEETMYLIEKSQEATICLNHYYGELFSSIYQLLLDDSFEEAKSCFFEYAVPAYQHSINHRKIAMCSDSPMIEKCLLNLMSRVEQEYPQIDFSVEIEEQLRIPKHLSLSLFKIITITSDNALEYLSRNDLSTLLIFIKGSKDSILFLTITNRILPDFQLSDLYKKGKVGRGFGLQMIKELVYKEGFEYSVHQLNNYLMMRFYLPY